MSAGALLLRGVPPQGVGVYARAQSAEWLSRFGFVALHGRRFDTPAKARALLEAGREVWLYTTPASWEPQTFRAEVARMLRLVRELGVSGFIADPESGWRGASSRVAAELGAMLRDAARETRVGVTSYPLWAHRRALAAECKGAVWASPQLYAKGRNPAHLQTWFGEWQEMFGRTRVIPGISGTIHMRDSDPRIETAEGFAWYLSTVPAAGGAIAWTAGIPRPHIGAGLDSYHPGGSLAAHLTLAAASRLNSPAGLVLLVLLVLVALAVSGGLYV